MAAQELSSAQLREARRFAVQFIYQLEVTQQPFFQSQTFERFCEQVSAPQEQQQYVRNVVQHVLSNQQRFDAAVERHAKNWKLSRISKVDLAIIRVCASELETRTDVSLKVIIADAAEIGKEYGAENSSSFVNGILDAIAREVRVSPLDSPKPK